MKEIILIKNGELALKGLNRSSFEDMMIKNMRHRLSSLGAFRYEKSQSTITVIPEDENIDLDEAVSRLLKVFGIAALSRAAVCEKDIDVIRNTALEYLGEALSEVRTFKVEAKRADKKFPFTSPQICEEIGGWLLEHTPGLRVDVHNPDLTVTVEVREKSAFIRGNQLHGAGGMPVGSGGNACLLISGGIDSPVAGWMMAKRGVRLNAVHFASPPYTSELAEKKVHELLGKVSEYAGRIRLFTVSFTELQEAIRDYCPEEMFTITMRRFMMQIAGAIAIRENCGALITGESLGQVASQTLHALGCTDECAPLPVFRPCIGMDKNEIVEISRKIDTFEISIRPYEDCCTVFTPKHPRTRATVELARQAEYKIENREELIQRAIDSAVLKIIG
ncbi:MAG: tRNA 4-thiouridine(8) synthase ThiI [Clostridia bacterium]|nr:tRNA 4-thiouridine(8) synthase ThiI [Clostridia bacterium]